ncbi:EAL and HDOD domain-containing protein [Halobacillus yeomjeoni]|uniref:HDOD domain-containing protein n=1 Tax=Halobacillus yeomjeoni TaxID=311194 RepID=A0A931HW15_9BACI|nr:HDOD domain-containing protein [Halobacillus yeomjeoni]MBH0230466.1 HDOD domain-containing protein [Halobacillus yeomjeoni]
MEVFVARQPILEANEEVYAYEILYRNSQDNRFTPVDDENRATSEVLMNSFLTIGLERLSQNKPCFINFTEDLLLDMVPEQFNPQQLVVEILEDVSHSMELIRVCRELKKNGFLIALDDVEDVSQTSVVELLLYVDIIKVDIRTVSEKSRKEIIQIAKDFNITLLAEKVETREEHKRCVNEGFELFQGFYYSKPVIVSGMDIPMLESSYFQIIREVTNSEDKVNINKISDILEKDLSLTYKLLRLINSSMYRRTVPIKSIKQAVMLLGIKSLKKWLYVLSVQQSAHLSSSSQLVLKSSLIRARMCERIADTINPIGNADDYFLTGFLSLIDVITQKKTSEVIESLPLDDRIKEALNGEENGYRKVLDIVIALEIADFNQLEKNIQGHGVQTQQLLKIYEDAIEWTESLYSEHFSHVPNK